MGYVTTTLILNALLVSSASATVDITKIEPTPYFPKVNQSEPLKQIDK